LSRLKNLFHHYVHQTSCEEASTFWGACGAIRKDIFQTIGGFDESSLIEDIELGWRLKKAGYRIKLAKTIQVKHLKRWNFLSLLKTEIFHRGLPWTDLILREGGWINDLNLKRSNRVSVLLTYGLLGSLIVGGWWPLSFAFGGLCVFLLLILNSPVYRFFFNRCGLSFMLEAIPLHWLYYSYCGFAFALGSIRYIFYGLKER